jgi:uncharacterized membrane protein YesL
VIGRLVAVLLIYGLAALVGGIVITLFPAEAVFLPLIALLSVILDSIKHNQSLGHFSTKGERVEEKP